MTRNLRLLVFGGRAYADQAFAFAVLDYLHRTRVIAEIIEGGATGADTLAREWAVSRGVPCTTVAAEWDRYGKRAGPMRNARMAAMKPHGGLQFPGGRGTEDMRAKCEQAGIPVLEAVRLMKFVQAMEKTGREHAEVFRRLAEK